MKLLSFLCVAALAAGAAASSDEPAGALARRAAANPQIVFAVSSPAFAPQCLNGQWTMFMNLAIKVTIGGVPNLLPMGEIGLPVIDMAFFVNGKAATTTVPSSFNVKPSTAAGNTWSFGLLDDQPNVGGQIQVGACKQGDATPTVTASFSSQTNIQGQGLANPKVPALSGIPTLVNNLAAANKAAAGAAATNTNTNTNTNNNNSGAAAANNNNNNGAAANTGATAAAAGVPPNQDGNCVLTYPNTKDPILSAAGLATPWTVTAGCDQTADTPSFIQGTIFDPATGNLFVYNPLIINVGTQPAVKPTVPTIPAGAIVALHFGTNGCSTTLADASKGAMLKAANCVNGGGADKSIFGQFAYCNAAAFFTAVNANLAKLNPPIPALGTDKTGQPCLTTRSFALVDQDPSDNVITTYLLTSDNKVAQNTAANQAALKAAGKSFNVLANGSDNRLVTLMDNIIGCKPYMAPDLADANTPIASLALNEIMAANRQQAPVAKIPITDPMVVLANGNVDTTGAKLAAYRMGVNENFANPANLGNGKNFCTNLMATAPSRYAAWATAGLTNNAPSPDAGTGTNMATFLGARFQAAWGLLGCDKLLNMASPITCVDANGKPAGDNPAAKCSIVTTISIQAVTDDPDFMPDTAASPATSEAASFTHVSVFTASVLAIGTMLFPLLQ